jgi:DNA-binding NtrC family response regulator
MEEPREADAAPVLNGVRVLVVEDDFIILMELEAVLLDAGAEIAALCRTVNEALVAADRNEVAVALLDVRLGSETVTPLARHLTEHGTPFVFYTGQVDVDPLLTEWPGSKVVAKPAPPSAIVGALADQLQR